MVRAMRVFLSAAGALALLAAATDLAASSAGAGSDDAYVPLGFVQSDAALASHDSDRDRPVANVTVVEKRPAPPLRMSVELDDGYVPLGFVDAVVASEMRDFAPGTDPVAKWLAAQIDAFSGSGVTAGERAAMLEFYEDIGFQPVWVEDGSLTPRARALIERIERADEEGLDPGLYLTPSPMTGEAVPAMARELAEAELRLSAAAMAYARHAQSGMVDPSGLGPDITAKPKRPDPYLVLSGLAKSDDPAAYLHGYNPAHPGFTALRDKLALMREGVPRVLRPRVPAGGLLRPGSSDPRVPTLRQRLDVPWTGTQDDAAELYDEALHTAVRAFQEQSGLVVDGIVGPATIQALNAARDVTIADLLINMERWRWLPPDMGGDHYVLVNIPEYRLRVMSSGESVFDTRVIVGTVTRQTPSFSHEIQYIEVNPYWNVPRSIAGKDLLPELRSDPLALHRRGIQVLHSSGGRTYEIDPRTVDWNAYTGANMPFRFRQVPGEINALGRIKFMFPNQHAVYLHDTPSRSLFSRSVRMFSSGCVRVEDPTAFSDALFALEDDLDGPRVERLIAAGQTRAVNLKHRVPVHLVYFTTWVDEAGETQLRSDIYGHDETLKRALGLDVQTVSSM
jgi:L,D-transpeptidase YcbB